MKKTLLVLIAITAFAFTTTAQEFKIGAKVGLNIASLQGDDLEELDSRTSFNLGAVAEFPISEKFSFQPELLYSAQGAKGEEDASDYDESLSGNIDLTAKLDYINLPLMAKYYVAPGFSIQAGPQIGFLVSAKSKAEVGDFSAEEDIKDNFKSIDFGLNFGLGYQFENGLFIDGRYNLGLSNIADYEDGDVKNGVFQFAVGYFFL
ncbi:MULTISPECIES: porin family protein [Galbibacter]|uniref:Porin family protein n=1 Tax=Galbibacter pacificus TaxID=2996052 RepID=A0ABT6FPH5_9FLAO|nr:porin family protein [Galbibacter pacificus]MDG3582358.1 porin family protein [Galbibacter pacificus]MDG3585166.1 porin family protein [Galbibacter pacificus]